MDSTPLTNALKSTPERAPLEKARSERELFCFLMAQLRVAVVSESVREVFRAGPITPLPRTPAFLMGVCGFRGEVLPVLDLLRFLGRGESKIGPRTRMFVGVAQSYVCAVVVDAIIGLRKVDTSLILPAPLGSDAAQEHLLGIVHEPGLGTLNLLSLDRILSSVRQRATAR